MTEPSQESNVTRKPVKHRFSKRIFFFSACAVIAIIVYCIANADHFASVFNNLGAVLTPLAIGGVIVVFGLGLALFLYRKGRKNSKKEK